MSAKSVIFRLFAVVTVMITTACVVREKVTVNGEVMDEGYKVKRPLRDAIGNSQ